MILVPDLMKNPYTIKTIETHTTNLLHEHMTFCSLVIWAYSITAHLILEKVDFDVLIISTVRLEKDIHSQHRSNDEGFQRILF